VTIDDYGILLTVGRRDSPGADVWRRLLERDAAESALEEALADSDLVKWHFRACSQTGLMVPRTRGQAERGPRQLQWSSEVIFEVLRRHEPGHPLLQEAVAEAKFRFLDLEQALTFLGTLATWQISLRDLERVSPFAFPMHASLIKETMMLEDPEDAIERLYHKWHGGR
jgi:ATP-dependent Lhr-like helicase